MLTVKDPKKIDWENMSIADCARGNAMDTYFTLKLFHVFYEELEELDLLKFYEKLMVPATVEVCESEYNGLDVDITKIDEVGKELEERIQKLEEELYAYPQVKEDHNLDSNKDLIDMLFIPKKDEDYRPESFNLYATNTTKKTGDPATDAETLKKVMSLIDEELGYREPPPF